jgi:transposase-like protein
MADARRVRPRDIVADDNPTYPIAVRSLQREAIPPASCRLCCSHKANNLIEQDHRRIQRGADAKQHFRSFAGARHTIAGYEAMHMLRKGQAETCERGNPVAQAQFVY